SRWGGGKESLDALGQRVPPRPVCTCRLSVVDRGPSLEPREPEILLSECRRSLGGGSGKEPARRGPAVERASAYRWQWSAGRRACCQHLAAIGLRNDSAEGRGRAERRAAAGIVRRPDSPRSGPLAPSSVVRNLRGMRLIWRNRGIGSRRSALRNR